MFILIHLKIALIQMQGTKYMLYKVIHGRIKNVPLYKVTHSLLINSQIYFGILEGAQIQLSPEIFTLLPVLVVVVVVVVVNLEVRVRFPGPLVVSVVVTGVPEVIPVSSSQVFEPRSLELDAIFLFLFSCQNTWCSSPHT